LAGKLIDIVEKASKKNLRKRSRKNYAIQKPPIPSG
jgi:hypothetical protein